MPTNRLPLLAALAASGCCPLIPMFKGKPAPSVAKPDLSQGPSPAAPTPPPKFINAASESAQLGAARVSVASVKVAPVALTDFQGAGPSEDDLLQIRIRIDNTSTEKKLNYSGLQGNQFLAQAFLKDNLDNRYKRITFGFGTKVVGQVRSESIYPGKSLDDLLVFEVPIDKASELFLELQGDNFEAEDMSATFKIPRSMWGK